MNYLSAATGNPSYAARANAFYNTVRSRPSIDGLWPNCWQQGRGRVTMGADGDSFYEYLIKGWLQTGKKDQRLWAMYNKAVDGMEKWLVAVGPDGLTYLNNLDMSSPTSGRPDVVRAGVGSTHRSHRSTTPISPLSWGHDCSRCHHCRRAAHQGRFVWPVGPLVRARCSPQRPCVSSRLSGHPFAALTGHGAPELLRPRVASSGSAPPEGLGQGPAPHRPRRHHRLHLLANVSRPYRRSNPRAGANQPPLLRERTHFRVLPVALSMCQTVSPLCRTAVSLLAGTSSSRRASAPSASKACAWISPAPTRGSTSCDPRRQRGGGTCWS